MADLSLDERVFKYLKKQDEVVKPKRFLGGGTDGDVWETTRDSAVKALRHIGGYYNERDTYLRLTEWGVTQQLSGFWIPKLRGYDDDLMIVEMELMHSPPYIIDFAKVRLDRPPEFSEETVAESERLGIERFEQHWPEVKLLLAALESFQIYYLDPQRGNITFPDMP